jgi:hypothetical protein
MLLINKKDSNMNNLSLKKLSITVVVASLASNLVFADSGDSNSLANVTQSTSSFAQLITDYDVDKNNTLSVQELVKNEKLTKIFAQLDTNADQEISEAEFKQYLAKLKKSLS